MVGRNRTGYCFGVGGDGWPDDRPKRVDDEVDESSDERLPLLMLPLGDGGTFITEQT